MYESKDDFIRISKLFLNFKLRVFIAILCMIIAALCTGFHAWLVKPALDNVLINADKFYLYFILKMGALSPPFSYSEQITVDLIFGGFESHIKSDMILSISFKTF